MWNEERRSRFRNLRQRERQGSLSDSERQELAALIRDVESAEADYLRPAVDRLRRQREALEKQNRVLEALANRKEALVRRLRDFLAEARAERQAIESELAAALSEGPASEK